MKTIQLLTFFILLSFSSCLLHPVHYLGESYPATLEVDVFYDADDIRRDFKAMGTMTSDPTSLNNFDYIKDSMINKAKEKGADAIVFEEIDITNDCDKSVKATLIRYL